MAVLQSIRSADSLVAFLKLERLARRANHVENLDIRLLKDLRVVAVEAVGRRNLALATQKDCPLLVLRDHFARHVTSLICHALGCIALGSVLTLAHRLLHVDFRTTSLAKLQEHVSMLVSHLVAIFGSIGRLFGPREDLLLGVASNVARLLLLRGYDLVLRRADLSHHVLINVHSSHDLLACLLQVLSLHIHSLGLHARRSLHKDAISRQHLRHLALEHLIFVLGPFGIVLVSSNGHSWVDLSEALGLSLKHAFLVDGAVVVQILECTIEFELLHQVLIVVVVLWVLKILLEVRRSSDRLTKLIKSWLLLGVSTLNLTVRPRHVRLLEHPVLRLLLLLWVFEMTPSWLRLSLLAARIDDTLALWLDELLAPLSLIHVAHVLLIHLQVGILLRVHDVFSLLILMLLLLLVLRSELDVDELLDVASGLLLLLLLQLVSGLVLRIAWHAHVVLLLARATVPASLVRPVHQILLLLHLLLGIEHIVLLAWLASLVVVVRSLEEGLIHPVHSALFVATLLVELLLVGVAWTDHHA